MITPQSRKSRSLRWRRCQVSKEQRAMKKYKGWMTSFSSFLYHSSVCSYLAMTHGQCYVYMIDDSFDNRDTHTLDSICKYHYEVCLLTQNSRPSSVSTRQRKVSNLWLSKHAFVIHAHQHREKCDWALPDSNQRSAVSNGICVQAIQTLLGRPAWMMYHCTIPPWQCL